MERIVTQIRRVWPKAPIMVRADSGFFREELMKWCEDHHLDDVAGLARNEKRQRLIEPQMIEISRQHEAT